MPDVLAADGRAIEASGRARTRATALLGAALLALATSACGDDDASPPGGFEAEARAIAEIVATDPSAPILDDVDHAIDTDRPVLASDLLAELGLPALRRQVTRLDDVRVTTAEGRTLRARAVRLYRARVTAYETYHDALVRGLVDDEALLDAIDAVSGSERAILQLQYDLRAIAPVASTEAASDEDEGPGLAGLPPVAREALLPDDESLGGEPEGREEDPALLEDALPEM